MHVVHMGHDATGTGESDSNGGGSGGVREIHGSRWLPFWMNDLVGLACCCKLSLETCGPAKQVQ